MKKNIAFDYRIIIYILGTLFICAVAFGFYNDGEKGMAVLGAVLTVVFSLGIVIFPKIYVGDEEGVSIYYLPFVKEYFRWDEIKRIRLKKSPGTSKSIILDFLWKEYEIVPVKQKKYKGSKYHSVFHTSEILRTPLSKKMIKKYWDGEIEDDTFSLLKKRFEKQNNEKIKYDLTDVKQKESWARESLKQIVQQYESKAALFGKTIDASCTYFTDDDDFNSRPKENYTYAAEVFIEIENDDERSFYIKEDILLVRYGKKDVKVTEIKKAFDEIAQKINEAIEK